MQTSSLGNPAMSVVGYNGLWERLSSRSIHEMKNLQHMLHAAIDLSHLLDMIYFEAQGFVSFDGLCFGNANHAFDYQAGLQGRHSAHYRLFANSDYIGELCLSRNSPFTDDELETLESVVSLLVLPLQDVLTYQLATGF